MNTLSSPSSRSARLPLVAAGAVAFTIVSWASAFPFIRIGLHGLAPLQLAAARFATAAVLAIAWLAWRRPRMPARRDALRFLVCGLLGIALYNALLNTGEQTVSAGAASFIVNTLPIFTALLAAVFLRERFNRRGWLGSLVSLAGIAVIAHGQPGGLVLGSGSTLILGAALCSASYFVLQRRLIPVYGALPCTAYTLLAGALLLTPWLPGALASLGGGGASRDTALAVLVLGVFPAALGYATWTFALGYFGAARAANFLYLTPAVATVLSMALTGERPGIETLCGGLLAIAGVIFVALRGRT
ncbi:MULTISPECIES: DMT family transporter [unclassified Burkholderia]|uniref:DMT family transporter n=1 Tax=unclassified Burkholderia TaxID=2613784 RepID=UPI000F5AC611|nr:MULTISPECIES: DMT family transporter [unclassified Burkholderia]RQR34510.1 DMT family transporter [Burkholderia sp. Bp9131]RQR66830.1 DMT family transporter [Burkholderia sp. Bp9015]RQS21039.1 DMT family transporter [Burkholderia sp. Bp8995]RQS33466.1 DMT family transporter [Burkholderia sp. Bp8990]RQS40758.1 DMT family transporter [Burkholderia sp. Bp8989]